MSLEEIVRRSGFASEKEFHKLVAAVDLSTPGQQDAFRAWQKNDGTKEGLLKLAVAPERPLAVAWAIICDQTGLLHDGPSHVPTLYREYKDAEQAILNSGDRCDRVVLVKIQLDEKE